MVGAGRQSATRGFFKSVLLQLILVLVSLVVTEGVLRVIDLRYLRIVVPRNEVASIFQFDPQLGWSPTPNAISTFPCNLRTINVHNNSLGLRDIEQAYTSKPTVLFIGDSFVWGYNVESDERFTEMLREKMPAYTIVNAGVSGFGTDQEYQMLRRLWPQLKPSIVVLIYHGDSDREDNSTNVRFDGYYKPYIVDAGDDRWEWRGLPVPKSRRSYFVENWFARNFLVARVAFSAYVILRNPFVKVPDPTEHLVGMIRDFVETRGGRFLVGLQGREARIETFLSEKNISFVTLDGADDYMPKDIHWTPKGNSFVANRLSTVLTRTDAPSSPNN